MKLNIQLIICKVYDMKKIVLILIIIEIIYALPPATTEKIKRLEQTLDNLNKKIIHIQNNQKKYNQLMTKYKQVSSPYQSLISLCKEINCSNETKELNNNFKELNKSIKVLDNMMEADIAAMHSIKLQTNLIKQLIKAERVQAALSKAEVEKVINEM